jgi:uncharacterized membrane protein
MERADLSRIMAFTDGVMAVAITLLVLNLEVPDVADDELKDALVDLLPSVYAYVLSFALIGRFWVLHHNRFETFVGFDAGLMALNLLFLALVGLIPFATDLLDRYSDSALATATFSVSVALASLCHWVMARYAVRKGFVDEARLHEYGWPQSVGGLAIGLFFLAAAPLAFVAVELAHVLWISTFLLRYPLRKLGTRVPR